MLKSLGSCLLILFAATAYASDVTSDVGGIKVNDGERWYWFGGRAHLDGTLFIGDYTDKLNELSSSVRLRRFRLEGKGRIHDDFMYQFGLDFVGNLLYEAYLTYTGLCDNLTFSFGQRIPEFGIEEVTSSNHLPFLELALDGSLQARNSIGVFADYHDHYWVAQAGVYVPRAEVTTFTPGGAPDPVGASLRGVYRVIHDCGVFQVGADLQHQRVHKMDGLAQPVSLASFGSRAETKARVDANVVSTGNFRSDHYWLYGPEFLVMYGPFEIEGELKFLRANQTDGDSLGFHAWHVTAGYVVWGEKRAYDYKKAVPKGLIAKSHNGHAVELLVRHSQINLIDKNVQGGKANNTAVGINWYISKNIRVLGNYIYSHAMKRAGYNDRDLHIVAARFQYAWG